ncbi:YhdT family protein [Fusibacter ferrireducens]|uniref:YhdT family protein n=1 Tax=Fusibacter ferrireducens TaxID=2785058 RepID=A0ABR9ZWV1_9FIRM|nr:YhdT family protein [Fusibacter ferrireducens]MBF4694836.1 YhdT family protein [Fusibacter ferrireducens]
MNFKEKNNQINKEAKITVGLYLFFFIWWVAFAYGIGLKDISEYKYILGFPSWFFYSCIVGYVMISFPLAFVVKKYFKDIDFEENDEEVK